MFIYGNKMMYNNKRLEKKAVSVLTMGTVVKKNIYVHERKKKRRRRAATLRGEKTLECFMLWDSSCTADCRNIPQQFYKVVFEEQQRTE